MLYSYSNPYHYNYKSSIKAQNSVSSAQCSAGSSHFFKLLLGSKLDILFRARLELDSARVLKESSRVLDDLYLRTWDENESRVLL